MSESNFPFGGTAVAEPPTEPAIDESVAGPDRRKLYLVGGVAGVLVLAVAAYFLLFSGGGSSSSDTAFGVPPHLAKKAAPAAAAAKPAKPVTLPKSNSAPVGRDPFKPLVTPPVAAASAAPSTSAAPAPAASQAPAGTGTSTQTKSVTPTWIELDSFTTTAATFRVAYSDGSTRVWQNVKVPAPGKSSMFATYFDFLKLSGGVATVQMGDGKPFTLKQGFANRHFFG